MSQTVNQTNTPRQTTAAPATFPGGRVTFANMLRSEWTKFWSVRSTWITLIVLEVILIGFSLIGAVSLEHDHNASAAMMPGATSLNATDTSIFSVMFAEIVMAVLAVLVITGEYASGEIRTSMLAAPGRWLVLAAKAVVVSVVAFVATFVGTFIGTLVGFPFIKSFVHDDRFSGLGLRIMAGAGLALVLIALMSLGIGTLVRNTALSIMIVVAVVFILVGVFQGVPVHWMHTASEYLIGNSVSGLFTPPADVDQADLTMSFGKALWVSALWAVIPLAGGAALLRVRDV